MNYLVDTNVILDDYKSVFVLSDNKQNVIILTETILKELDKFKVGQDSINYNAREFIRMLNDSEATATKDGLVVENCKFKILILKDVEYDGNYDDIIIHTGIKYFSKEDIVFISNDILFRTKVLLYDYKAQPFRNNIFKNDLNFIQSVYYENEFLNKEYFSVEELEKILDITIEEHISVMNINEYSGHTNYLIRETSTMFRKIDLKKDINIFGIKQKNIEQRLFLEIALSDTDIFVVDALAGSGKTLLALLASLKMVDKGEYDKIYYIRKTIISGDKQDEIGFLPGSLDRKIGGYLYPLKDNLEVIVKAKNNKKKNWTADEIENAIKEYENKFNINYEYQGHLRGRTLSGIIIIDEAQNFNIKDKILILSRIAEGSKVFIIGSTKQIDNPFVNKYNNALTFMLNNTGDTFNGLKIRGFKMSKVERGRITEWIENITK